MSSSDAMSIDEGPLWQPDRKERKRKRSAERDKHSKKRRQSLDEKVGHTGTSRSLRPRAYREVNLAKVPAVVRPYMLILRGIPRSMDETGKWAVPSEWGNSAITSSLGIAGEGLQNTVKVLYGFSGVVGEGSNGVATAKYQDYISVLKAAKAFECAGQGRNAYVEEMKLGKTNNQKPKIFGWLARKEDMEKLRIKKKYWSVVSLEEAMKANLKMAEEVTLLKAKVEAKKKVLVAEERKARQSHQTQETEKEEDKKENVVLQDWEPEPVRREDRRDHNTVKEMYESPDEAQDEERVRVVKKQKPNLEMEESSTIAKTREKRKKSLSLAFRSSQSKRKIPKYQEIEEEPKEDNTRKHEAPTAHIDGRLGDVEEYSFLKWAAWEAERTSKIQTRKDTSILFPPHAVELDKLQDTFACSSSRAKDVCGSCMEHINQSNEDPKSSASKNPQIVSFASCSHVICEKCAEQIMPRGSCSEAQVCPLC